MMEVALRRRLEGVSSISISQERQTAHVRFVPGAHVFSSAEFRAAVQEADVEVLHFEIDVCGRVETRDGSIWLVAGPNRYILMDAPRASAVCITASLDDQSELHRLSTVRDRATDAAATGLQ